MEFTRRSILAIGAGGVAAVALPSLPAMASATSHDNTKPKIEHNTMKSKSVPPKTGCLTAAESALLVHPRKVRVAISSGS